MNTDAFTLPPIRTRHHLAVLAACCALLVAGSALADERDTSVRSTVVRAAPSELRDADAARAVYARIQHAARQVCGRPHRLVLRELEAMNECRADAIEDAVAEAGSAQLLAVHRESTGESATRLATTEDRQQH